MVPLGAIPHWIVTVTMEDFLTAYGATGAWEHFIQLEWRMVHLALMFLLLVLTPHHMFVHATYINYAGGMRV